MIVDPAVIGIAAVREEASWSFWRQRAHLVADSYVAAVQRSGALALLLPVDRRSPEPLLDRIDGLLLIGGADVDPASYGAEREAETESTYPERDASEIALVRGALARDLPVLGICRGMQILNVALGGDLRQDLADAEGNNRHRRALGSFDGTDHAVALEPGSLAARATGERVHRVHCHHHQAVGALGEGLVVSGRDSEDGVIEAIECGEDRWVLGVQWHPEAEPESPLLPYFTDASRDSGRIRT